jgi:hypothetical protein
VEAELVLNSGRLNQSVTVSGVPDILDDGAQQFAIAVGPCSSIDTRFNFDWVHARVASGWNEDHGFPLVKSIEPTQSAMLGESITISGRHLNRETNVCVNGMYVSAPPDHRVSLTIVTPSGDATAFEVTLQGPSAAQWFQNVSGTEYHPYAPRPCPQLAERRRLSVHVQSTGTATSAANNGANNEAAVAAAKGIGINSIRYGVIDSTEGPTASASTDIADVSGLGILGTLSVADLEFKFTAVSHVPTEPLLNQARTQLSTVVLRSGDKCQWMQVKVASVNTTLDATLLAKLGIQYEYNFSDSDSSDSGSGDGAVSALLAVDFVQRFNFSATDDGTITFCSPQARTEGYAPMLVFDKAGASTDLAESIFYNLKVRTTKYE